MWFLFRQHNVRGLFKSPAMEVVIESDSMEEAEAFLLNHVIEDNDYCECCGTRWEKGWGYEISDDEVFVTPSASDIERAKQDNVEVVRLVIVKRFPELVLVV